MTTFCWDKKGLIYKPDKYSKWPTHAVLPFIDKQEDKYYMYFGSRTKDNVAYSFRAEFDYKNNKILSHSKKPILKPGEIGCFDQHGAISSSIVSIDNLKYLYYIGWTKGHEPPLFYASIGLAISENSGKSFRKVSKAPIIPRDDKNPILMTSPHVIYVNNYFYMAYISGVKWEKINGDLKSFYRICSAESKNGFEWYNTGNVLIDLKDQETNHARPWIINYQNNFHMFFSKKSNLSQYNFGYASSKDLNNWVRDDTKIKMKGNESSFDSEMICYPSVSKIEKKLYLFYNGNKFGFDGAGLATLNL